MEKHKNPMQFESEDAALDYIADVAPGSLLTYRLMAFLSVEDTARVIAVLEHTCQWCGEGDFETCQCYNDE